jgi:hypothetical protein
MLQTILRCLMLASHKGMVSTPKACVFDLEDLEEY